MYVTPCVSICVIDKDSKKCKGCGRTGEQISHWTKYSDEQRMSIMKELGYGKRTSKKDRMVRKQIRRTSEES